MAFRLRIIPANAQWRKALAMKNHVLPNDASDRSPAILTGEPPRNLAPADHGPTVDPREQAHPVVGQEYLPPRNDPAAFSNRWWTYQRERFPLAVHGPAIFLLGLSAVCFSTLSRGDSRPSLRAIVVACVTTLIFFFHLRVADEWKDYDDDLQFRPYRSVPRGLVTLKELRSLALLGAILQLMLTAWIGPALLPLLFFVWIYLGLMTKEFFVRDWLKAHPLAYLGSHMLILPLIYLYATGCDWCVTSGVRWRALGWLLASSFFSGMVFEFGRKIRAPGDEETGVETYTALWGAKTAVTAWVLAIVLSGATATVAAHEFAAEAVRIVALAALAATSWSAAVAFVRAPSHRSSSRIELLSGLWTLVLLFSIGPLPLLMSYWSRS